MLSTIEKHTINEKIFIHAIIEQNLIHYRSSYFYYDYNLTIITYFKNRYFKLCYQNLICKLNMILNYIVFFQVSQ